MKHKYQLVIDFESDISIKPCSNLEIQFGNGLRYFVYNGKRDIDQSYIYGSGKIKLKKVKKA